MGVDVHVEEGLLGEGGGDDEVHRSKASTWVMVAMTIASKRDARAWLEAVGAVEVAGSIAMGVARSTTSVRGERGGRGL
jgi:hypothetical protein